MNENKDNFDYGECDARLSLCGNIVKNSFLRKPPNDFLLMRGVFNDDGILQCAEIADKESGESVRVSSYMLAVVMGSIQEEIIDY